MDEIPQTPRNADLPNMSKIKHVSLRLDLHGLKTD